MNEPSPSSTSPAGEPPGIDTSRPHPARIYDYLLGGTDNFPADRAATEASFGRFPGGLDGARANARANRAFLGRAVRFLAGEAGVTQFLDIGSGIPTADNVHQVAQRVAPAARVVYVDNDPLVLAQADALLTTTPQGATAYVQGDLRQPDEILTRAASTLDFTQPVAVMLVGILHFVPDAEDPYGIVARLRDAVPPGGYLVLSHMAADIRPEQMAAMAEQLNQAMPETMVLRTRDEVAGFLDGLDLVEPGIVAVSDWRPESPSPDGPEMAIHCAAGRKP